ncbi:MAG: class I SAM-dependent rRNA methyltransferase [Deltaproteobacteria bacterium]|nr:class I SAM-dependent rRNA methyltransferase [Deltaproteobacteria bacterium]
MPSVVLKPGHVQPVWSGHPWVYAQAVDRVEGGALAGEEVSVLDPRGNLLGRGFYSPRSAIPVRILVRDATTVIGAEFIRDRLKRARDQRRELGLPNEKTTGYRLVHSEGDRLPGLVVDIFDDVAVVQMTTIGMKRREALIIDSLCDLVKVKTVIDRTPETYSKSEGFDAGSGVIRGDDKLDRLCFRERDVLYEIPLTVAQKTGFYFDQRPLRARVEQLSRGRRVLDTYSFVGSFAIAASRGGATQVMAVDENALALEVAARCALLNNVSERIAWERGPARDALVRAGNKGGYDLVIVDPPNLAPSTKATQKGLAAYQKLATVACPATRPGGLLVISACSAALGLGALTRAIALGARDVGMVVTVLERMFQGADHPVPAAFQEGLYLKSLICRVDTR